MRAIKLDKELPCEYICHQLQLLINDHRRSQSDLSECVLIMDIRQIIDDSPHPTVPLIEHQAG